MSSTDPIFFAVAIATLMAPSINGFRRNWRLALALSIATLLVTSFDSIGKRQASLAVVYFYSQLVLLATLAGGAVTPALISIQISIRSLLPVFGLLLLLHVFLPDTPDTSSDTIDLKEASLWAAAVLGGVGVYLSRGNGRRRFSSWLRRWFDGNSDDNGNTP